MKNINSCRTVRKVIEGDWILVVLLEGGESFLTDRRSVCEILSKPTAEVSLNRD